MDYARANSVRLKLIVYVGDSRDVVKRILTNHCSGNVEASALRRYIAEAKGYKIKSTKRSSGSTKVRIDLPSPRTGEMNVSNYIRSGNWRYVLCDSYSEANDFQWYAIEKLNPFLNRDRKPWDHGKIMRYQTLLSRLTNSMGLNCDELKGIQSGPGVYVLYHQQRP